MDNPERENNYLKYLKPLPIIMVVGLLLYIQTLFYKFTNLDDVYLIINNQHFLSNILNIFKSFTTDVFYLSNGTAFYYRPILTISLMLDYQVGGVTPLIYHFTNIILHVVSSYLVFVFLIKLNYKKTVSFLFSLIFLVHPVLTQAVAWIPGRNDSLLAIFVLSTFIFFLEYLENEKISNLVLALIFFALALFTKETGIFIAPIIFLYMYFIYKKNKLSFNKYYFFIGVAGIAEFWIILRGLVIHNSSLMSMAKIISSIFINLPASIQFFGKIFFPFNLNVMPTMQDTTFIYGIISIILLGALIFFTRVKRWNYIIMGFVWFAIFLLPSFLHLNSALEPYFLEHRLYVPIIGIFIILLETDLIKNLNFDKRRTVIIFGGIILLFGIITINHSKNFANKIAFWQNASKNTVNYSWTHQKLIDAEEEFKKEVENLKIIQTFPIK